MRNETQGRAPEKKRRGWIVPVALLAVLLLTGSMLMLLDGRHVRFYMTGEQEMRLHLCAALYGALVLGQL